MIITIAGSVGSGKSSVAKGVAERLGYRHFSVGDYRRQKAAQRGISILEYNKLGDTDPTIDKDSDDWQRGLAEKERDFVIDSRLGFHFIPKSVKVLLTVSPEVGAKRLAMQDRTERKSERIGDIGEAVKKIRERNATDRARYQKMYGVDIFGRENYDLVVDTDPITAEEVVEKVLEYVQGKGL